MAEEKVKRNRVFDRSYNDAEGKVTISDSKSGDEVMEFGIEAIAAKVSLGGAMRYLTDAIVGAGTAALKAEGGNAEKALEAMQETYDAMVAGEYAFRAGAGEGGLTVEQEKDVIVKTAMELDKSITEEQARATVESLYAVVKERKQTIKGKERVVKARPEYSKLKRIPQIRQALEKAAGDSGVATLKSLFAAPTTEDGK